MNTEARIQQGVDNVMRIIENSGLNGSAYKILVESAAKMNMESRVISGIQDHIEKEGMKMDDDAKARLVKRVICERYKIEMFQLEGPRKPRKIVTPRQICMWWLSNPINSKLSLGSIGKHFGDRDHSTVIHAKQVVNDLMDIDKVFKEEVESVADEIRMAICQYSAGERKQEAFVFGSSDLKGSSTSVIFPDAALPFEINQ